MTDTTPTTDPKPQRFAQRLIVWASLAVVAANLVKYCFFKIYPIYADEIGYRLMFARYLLDGHERISPWAACASSYAIKLPFLMRIAAYALSPLATVTNFAVFRIAAIAILALGVACVVLAARRLRLPLRSPEVVATVLLLAAFVMSVQTFSPASVALYMIRGEYLLLMAMPLLLFAIGKEHLSRPEQWTWYAAAVALFTTSAYVHPKTLFYLPFFAGFAWFLFAKSPLALRAVLLLPFAAIAKQCVAITNAQWLICDEYPDLAAFNASFNINIFDLLKGKPGVLRDLIDANDGAQVRKIFRDALFSVDYMNHAPDTFPLEPAGSHWATLGYPLANIFIIVCVALFLIGAVVVVVTTARHLVKRIGGTPESAVIALAGIGILCTALHLALNRSRNFYDVASWMYLFALCAAFGLLAIYSTRFKSGAGFGRMQPYRPWIYAALALVLLAGNLENTLLLKKTFYKPMLQGWTGNDSMPILRAKDRRSEAQRVADFLPRCGPVTPDSRFIVDYRVYPYLEQYPKPASFKWMWITFNTVFHKKEKYRAADNWKLMTAYMKDHGMTAAVGICPTFLPKPRGITLIKEASSHGWDGSFCCVAAPR